jgi:N6-L-threonylcarbamoyladenine synthase
MYILGLETSCDETAAAIVHLPTRRIVSQQVYTQVVEHAAYQGVVPELASRAHLARLPAIVERTCADSGLALTQLHAVAATVGPGLTTALAIGTAFGKTLALTLGIPFLATNHLEGHALSPLLAPTGDALAQAFFSHQQPYLLMLLTGGHCQLVRVSGVGHYQLLGTTVDDAIGEAFDKIGKKLGLPHPAGPAVEQCAKTGNPTAYTFPQPRLANPLDFSFSGLKTSVINTLNQNSPLTPTHQADLAASFQHTVAAILTARLHTALTLQPTPHVVVAGGAAANLTLRAALQQVCTQHNTTFTAPPLALCADNAAMIAYAAGLRHTAGLPTGNLTTRPLPRWPLEAMNA